MKQEMERQVSEFDITDLLPIAMTFVVVGIGVAYGLSVMTDVQGDMTTGSAAYNATSSAILGVKKIPDKLPLIATVVVAAVIIGILVRYLFLRFT